MRENLKKIDEQILKLLDTIIEKLGEDQTQEIIRALNGISNIADEVIN